MLIFPFAKINLGLHVVEKRVDGYHNLDTLFFPVKFLHDALEVVNAQEYSISVYNSNEEIDPEKNLVTKAFRLLEKDYKINPVEVHLIKRIPSKAGLGGGSSDAAFMLMLLNRHFRLGISVEELTAYALQLGSDCPFFIHNSPMYGRGRGDVLSPAALNLTGFLLVIVTPLREGSPLEISTADAFSQIIPDARREAVAEILATTAPNEWRGRLKNDFEDSLKENYPEIGQCIKVLYEKGAVYASLSGSGSACYGIFAPDTEINFFSSPLLVEVAKGKL